MARNWGIGAAIVLLCTLAASACGGPTTPTTIPGPTITCPDAPAAVQSTTGQPVAVGYGAVNSVGGSPPVTIACTLPSGALFPVGSTVVTCTASDALKRASNCGFLVSVNAPPPPPPPTRLGVTTFLAFGDSITIGEVPDLTGNLVGVWRLMDIERDKAYPVVLESLLRQRYTAQAAQISVVNDGVRGERASVGALRLDGELIKNQPNVLLLLEGVNDFDQPISTTIAVLQSMIRDGKRRAAFVLVGTLLPENPSPSLPFPRGGNASLIVPFNAQLAPMVRSEGALLVDLYTPFLAHMNDWISDVDGLHPNEAGYAAMAQIFFDAIKATFETSATTSSPARTGSSAMPPAGGRGSRAVTRRFR